MIASKSSSPLRNAQRPQHVRALLWIALLGKHRVLKPWQHIAILHVVDLQPQGLSAAGVNWTRDEAGAKQTVHGCCALA